MHRKFLEDSLLIGSNNPDKAKEILRYLKHYKIKIYKPSDFNLSEPEETEDSFIGNAELKARHYGNLIKMPVIADDSGLCVDALDGLPGIYSARWAGAGKDFEQAADKIKKALDLTGNSDEFPTARFVCVLSIYWPENGHIESFRGEIEGTLHFDKKGEHGFGYDPIFMPNGYDKTFAQMPFEEKKAISHRTEAFKQLIKACFSE